MKFLEFQFFLKSLNGYIRWHLKYFREQSGFSKEDVLRISEFDFFFNSLQEYVKYLNYRDYNFLSKTFH